MTLDPSKIKILMADDESEVLSIMAKKVAAEGYQVVTANDGEEAWEKIKTESPDVILLDITMPKKDGFSVLKELRTNPPSSKWQPVIIISAHRELDSMKQGFSLDADHYIIKPCSIADILKSIRLMINLIPHRQNE